MKSPNLTRVTLAEIRTLANRLHDEHPNYSWGKGEFANLVFEHISVERNLPWINHKSVGAIPDWDDERIVELNRNVQNKMERL